MSLITCPDCGTLSEIEQLSREADEFCLECDYPLFWAPGAARALQGASVSSGEGLRRLPGAGGHRELGAPDCPTCGEYQALGTETCDRCGNPMVLPEPEPEPEPQPVVYAPLPPAPVDPVPERNLEILWLVALVVVLSVVTAAVLFLI